MYILSCEDATCLGGTVGMEHTSHLWHRSFSSREKAIQYAINYCKRQKCDEHIVDACKKLKRRNAVDAYAYIFSISLETIF